MAVRMRAELLSAFCLCVSVLLVGFRNSGVQDTALAQTSEAMRVAAEEEQGSSYAKQAAQFGKAARVASEEEKDAYRHGPVDTLAEASERLDLVRGKMLSSAADHTALENLSGALRSYSQALMRHKHGLEFESPGAYRQLSSFELKHPSLTRRRKQGVVDKSEFSASLQSAARHAHEAQRLEHGARANARSRGGRRGVRRRGSTVSVAANPTSQLSREVASIRAEMLRLQEEGGPPREFPAFAGRQVKGFPYNVMGNMMAAVNAV
mmetsp:Transcript_10313/g.14809  ORF Transcript_10313/g.14809 Transcript_10313/m.14809 type:complete len:265 (-) Transcript_10313:26-820(-)